MEQYLEAADTALDAGHRQPAAAADRSRRRYSLKDEHQVKTTTESVYRQLDDAVVLFSSSAWQRGHAVASSTRRTAASTASASPPPRFQSPASRSPSASTAAGMRMAGKSAPGRLLRRPRRQADRRSSSSSHMEPQDDHLASSPTGWPSAQTVHKIGADKYKGPGLAVQWVEVEGPLHDTWPPASHRRIFGDLPQAPAPISNDRNRVEVVSKDPLADAERILRDFARRAFRRAVTDEDVKPFLACVKAKLAAKHSFEQAVRVGLKAVLVSPEFLFLREKPGKLDDFALASRLSYFLWSSMPDEELLTLAEQGKLSQPDDAPPAGRADAQGPEGGGLHRELRRPVARPARHRRHRCPSHVLYPEYDDMLKVSMVKETELFFDEVLKNDLSLTNFVASDFTMLNGRLAKHYGIPGVDGLGVPQGDAAAGQPPRRRADDGERAEGDGQRHHDLAGPARGVGAGPHPGHAAAQAARRTSRPSSRTSAAPRRSASNWPSTGRSPRARAATPRSTRRASRWRASTSSAAGATTTAASATGSR